MKGKYILLSAHREENIDIEQNFFSLMNAVNEMARTYDMTVLYSCHPRSEKMIEKRGIKFDERVIRHKPLGFFDYNKLQQNAFCVVSDSGTIPEEGAFFISQLYQYVLLQNVQKRWIKGYLLSVVLHQKLYAKP